VLRTKISVPFLNRGVFWIEPETAMRHILDTDRPSLIHYGSGLTPLGRTLIAMSERGICVLKLAGAIGEPKALDELCRRFTDARLVRSDEIIEPVLRQLNELLAGKRDRLDMPLDLHGTEFQKQVWQEMSRIRSGETCSYRDLARRAGHPRAVRAVASACARNPVAILVPCHRVVRSDGGMGGYRWGLHRKRRLLRQEAARGD
jgi:AraC family transcriptional regulator, regulatory protein of adaptative response / methylated-DNA-[protein]-cysteine methyltransferase